MTRAYKFVGVGLLLGLATGLGEGCVEPNPNHCHNRLDNDEASPCSSNEVCNSCLSTNDGCTPVDDINDYDASCFEHGDVGDDGDDDPTDTYSESEDSADDSETETDTETGTGRDTDTGTGTDETGTGTDDGDETGTTGTDDGDETGTETDDGDETDTGTDTDTGDTGTGTDTDTDSTGTDDTGSTSTDPPPECTEDANCLSEDEPFCEGGMCVDCNGLTMDTCATKTPEAPVCRDDGVCVECTADEDAACTDPTPICEANECRGCEEHSECDSACNLDTGSCITATPLLVNSGTCTMGDQQGTEANPYCTVSGAVAAIPGTGPGVVVVQNGGMLYDERVDISGNKVVAILGEGNPEMRAPNLPVFDVRTGGKVFASGLQMGGGTTANGVDCANGTVWLDDSEVSDTSDQGINSQNCTVHVRRTTVTGSGADGIQMLTGGTLTLEDVTLSGNTGWGMSAAGASVDASRTEVLTNSGGGIELTSGAELSMDTSIVGRNGDDIYATRALSVSSSEATLVYVTMAGADGNDGAKSIGCTGGTVVIRNSIVVAQETETVDCPGITVTTSAVQDMDIVSENLDVGAWQTAWFADAGGDFHLGTAQNDFLNAARWLTGDPATDIDGNARPSTDNETDWPGADVPE